MQRVQHVQAGGKMFWAVAGAMSSAQLGITLAPAIRAGLIHGLSVTGANLEESLFRLVAERPWISPARIAGARVMPSCAEDMAPATAQNMRPPPETWRQ